MGGSISKLTQKQPANGKLHSDLALNGTGSTLYLGYRLSFIAVEGLYKTFSAKDSDGDKEFKIAGTATGLGGRLYFISLFNYKFGILNHATKGSLKENETELLAYESTASSHFNGVGIRFNLSKLDIFIDYTHYSQEDDEESEVTLDFEEIELGARYYF